MENRHVNIAIFYAYVLAVTVLGIGCLGKAIIGAAIGAVKKILRCA